MPPGPTELTAGSENEMPPDHQPTRGTKRSHPRATTAPRKRGRRVSLSRLTDMPMDVIFEILSHLHPGDLLSVARTTKLFHGLLTRRSAVTIWRAALKSVPGLPECPPNMSELALANLLFSNHCHYCAKPGCTAIEWELPARVCKTCREDPDLFTNMRVLGGAKDCLSMLKYLPSIRKGKDVFLRPNDIEWLNTIWQDSNRENGNDPEAKKRDRQKILAYERTSRKEYNEHISAVRRWSMERNNDRGRELDELREERRNAVWEKLAELGLGGERTRMPLYEQGVIEHLEGMKEPTPLTERGWEKVKEPIITFVQKCRKERLRNIRCKPYKEVLETLLTHLNDFLRSQSLDAVLPTAGDFFMSPLIRPIIHDLVEHGIDTLDVEQFQQLIPEVCGAHREQISAQLQTLLPPWLQPEQCPLENPLESALVWFNCSSGNEPTWEPCGMTALAYPRIVGHCHMHRRMAFVLEPQDSDDDLVNALKDTYVLNSGRFSKEELESSVAFDLHSSFVAAQIVEVCGLDPVTATYLDMDELDARIACVSCKRIMTWRKAVTHLYKFRHPTGRSWVLLHEDDTRRVKKLEDGYKPKTTTGQFYCVYCRRFSISWQYGYKGLKALKIHLAGAHQIDKFRPKQNVDYFFEAGEPTSDLQLPQPWKYNATEYEVTTPALVAEGW